MISDRPVLGYQLVTKRDTTTNTGYTLANRPIQTGGPTEFKHHIRRASKQYGVDAALIEAVIQIESGFDPNTVSKKSATGLMQLMSATASRYVVRDRFDPRQNINAGVQHLRHLIDRFDGEITLVLAAYNAGAGAVDKHRGVPPYPETKRYISKVLNLHSHYRKLRYGS